MVKLLWPFLNRRLLAQNDLKSGCIWLVKDTDFARHALKEPQVIETRALSRIGVELITAKTQVKIHFVLYLNFN